MKMRSFYLGPATTVAIAGAIVAAYMRFPQWQREASESRQLELARADLAQKQRAKAPAVRTLDALWQQRAALSLSAVQIQALQRLRTEEAKRVSPSKDTAEKAERIFQVWVKAHQNGASLSDIQVQAAAYSAASAEYTLARQQFWNRGLRLLTPTQRLKIEGLTRVQS